MIMRTSDSARNPKYHEYYIETYKKHSYYFYRVKNSVIVRSENNPLRVVTREVIHFGDDEIFTNHSSHNLIP